MHPVNKEEYEYVVLLAKEYTTQLEFYEDESGNEGYAVDFRRSLATFQRRIDENRIKAPFTKPQYLDNDDIISTIEGYEIDEDKFWYAMLFIYDYVQGMCVKGEGRANTPSPYEQLQAFADYLRKYPDAEITVKHANAKKKDTLVIGNDEAVGMCIEQGLIAESHRIADLLKNGTVDEQNWVRATVVDRKTNLSSETSENTGTMMTLATKMYKTLFEQLKLPAKQAAYCRDYTEDISYNKMLLISRILYFYKYTDNESYLVDDDNLKKVFKEYKDKEIKAPMTASY